MVLHALKDPSEPCIRIDAIHAGGLDQSIGHGRDEIHKARKLRGGGQISGAFKAATRAIGACEISSAKKGVGGEATLVQNKSYAASGTRCRTE